jgi:Mg2+ and Co2+ transporter CorA
MLEVLLNETSSNPNASMLRRMLALRKGLNSFMTSVKTVLTAIDGVLKSEHNLLGGRRLSTSFHEFEAEELELLLEAYSTELKEIELELLNVGKKIKLYTHIGL